MLTAAILAGCTKVMRLNPFSNPIPGFQNDGSYMPTSEEEALNCSGLNRRVTDMVLEMRALPAQAAAEQASNSFAMGEALKRVFGSSGEALPSLKEYDRSRVRAQALNALAVKKGCTPVDVDGGLAQADAAVAKLRQ